MVDFFAFFIVLFLCLILDLIFSPVICSFQDVSGWKLRRIARDLPQAQKGNSYKSCKSVCVNVSASSALAYKEWFPSIIIVPLVLAVNVSSLTSKFV